jgi:hypothetical protein
MATDKKKIDAYEREDQELVLRPGGDWTKRVNVDIPVWAIKELDRESNRRGITRQALIKTWLIDQLDSIREKVDRQKIS